MTMSTGQKWAGKALACMMFIGVAGSPFPVFGGDDMVGYIQDTSRIWRLKNFGLAFVAPYANLNLASSLICFFSWGWCFLLPTGTEIFLGRGVTCHEHSGLPWREWRGTFCSRLVALCFECPFLANKILN